MEPNKQLENYIYQQLQSGIHPEEITQQLRTAGWDENTISETFATVQAAIAPSPQPPANDTAPTDMQQTEGKNIHTDDTTPQYSRPESDTTVRFEPTGKKRGRFKTAWLLMKQSFKVLKNNKQLLRYPFMGGILSLLISIIFALILFSGGDTFMYRGTDAFGDSELYFTGPGMVAAFIYYVVISFAIFMYNAGLAAHTLDLFRGKTGSYTHYMKRAWAKKGAIFIYSVITATVGLILRAIEQRSRLIGLIVSRIFGVLWNLANLFTIPIIVETDNTAPAAIKQSAKLFISRWGENVIARVTFGGIAFLLYLLLLIPFLIVLGIAASALGTAGIIVFIVGFIVSIIIFATVETAASNILSTALYYYAQYQQVPAAFDPELLNAALVPKKKRKKLFSKN